MTEIEIKARVADAEATERRVRAFARFEGETQKLDAYWKLANPRDSGEFIKVRIRDEGGKATVTYKRKETRGDLEVNDEREFAVSDRPAFESLIADLGFEPYIEKRKDTRLFSVETDSGFAVSIELSLVERLGWFLELEILTDDPDEQTIARAEAALRETLARSGVGDDAIERRFYTEMLSELGADTTDLRQLPKK